MPLVATPARRRIVMAVLLLLAVCGGVIRHFAPDPSTLRDVGTLLLVLWLPAVGNLIAYLIRRIPRRAPRAAPGFPEAGAFAAHLSARLDAIELEPAAGALLAAEGRACMLLVGDQAFTARLAQPVARALAAPQPQPIELLRPAAALAQLAPGTAFHLLIGTTAVAKGRVEDSPQPGALH